MLPEQGIKFYPNPSNGKFNLEFKVNSDQAHVKIYDANKKLVFENTYTGEGTQVNESIDISNQPSGIYIIQLDQGGNSEIQKIIIE